MADKRVARFPDGPAEYSGSASGLAVKSADGLLRFNNNGNQKVINASRLISTGAGNVTLSIEDSGSMVQFNNSTSRVVTLPATVEGAEFIFFVQTVTAGAGHSIVPNASDKITGNGLALADSIGIECDGATDRVGDCLVLRGDGVDGWFVQSVNGTWSSV